MGTELFLTWLFSFGYPKYLLIDSLSIYHTKWNTFFLNEMMVLITRFEKVRISSFIDCADRKRGNDRVLLDNLFYAV